MIKFSKRELNIYIGCLTISLYWPKIYARVGHEKLNPNEHYSYAKTEVGFTAQTQIFYTRPYDGWSWDRALAVRVLGFGFGLAWKHCDNPNVSENPNMKDKEI